MPTIEELGFKPTAQKAPGVDLSSLGFKPRGSSQAGSEPLNVVEEMHPDISAIDRLVVKNLANAPEVGVKYIQKKLPNHDVRLYQNRLVVKGPQDKEYRVLDPDTGFFSKDILRDAGDVLFDVGSGVAEGAAVSAGALAGGLPGAVAAGGASGAGLEAARQGLGKLAGLEQDIDGGDVALSGGVSAAFPLVGAAAKGAYGVAKKKLFPAVAEWASGVPRGAITHTGRNFAKIDMLNEEDAIESLIEEGVEKKARGAIFDRLGKAGRLEEKAITGIKGEIKTAEILSPLEDLLNKFKSDAKELGSEVAGQKVTDLEATLKGLVGEKEAISAKGAFSLQKELRRMAKLHNLANAGAVQSRHGASMPIADKQISDAANKAVKLINEKFDALGGKRVGVARSAYHQAKKDQTYLNKLMKTPESTYSMLTSLRSKPLRLSRLNDIDERYGLGLIEAAKDLDAHKYMGKPALNAISGLGATSTTRTAGLGLAGASIGSLAGYNSDSLPGSGYARAAAGGAAGAALGGALGSPAAIKAIIKNALRGERAAAKIKPGTVPGVAKSIWELGRDR